jgi:hypothetical protein
VAESLEEMGAGEEKKKQRGEGGNYLVRQQIWSEIIAS